MQLLSIDNPREAATARAIGEILKRVPDVTARVERVADVQAKPNSQLSDDDAATAPLQHSHVVDICMLLAVDNLLMLRDVVLIDGERVQLRHSAHYPTIRTIMEASATALWLTRPEDQRTRIVRTLQVRVADASYGLTLAKSAAVMIGSASGDARSNSQRVIREATRLKREHLGWAARIAEASGIEAHEYAELPGYAEIIRIATADHPLGGHVGGVTWRIISGFTHPSPLRSTHFTTHMSREDRGGGVDRVVSTSNPGFAYSGLALAVDSLEAAVQELGERKIRPAIGRRTS